MFAILLLAGALFYGSTSLTVERLEDHPYTSILKQKLDPRFRALSKNGILREKQLITSLSLSDHQQDQIEKIFLTYDDEWSEIYLSWKEQNPDARYYVPFSAMAEGKFVLKKHSQAIAVLSERQKSLLTQIEYRMANWDFVFFDNVSENLDITDSQLNEVKDLQVEFIREKSRLHRTFKSNQDNFKSELAKLESAFEFRFRSIFSTTQLQQIVQTLGKTE